MPEKNRAYEKAACTIWRTPLAFPYGGEGGIRTHAALADTGGFQDRSLQPLEYLSINNQSYYSRLPLTLSNKEPLAIIALAPFGGTCPLKGGTPMEQLILVLSLVLFIIIELKK